MRRFVRLLPILALTGFVAACSEPPPPAATPAGPTAAPAAHARPAPAATAEDRRLAAMRERHAELEHLQKDARTRFHDLRYRAGRTQLAPGQARGLNELLQQAGYRLQLPKGLGAFSDVTGIEQEIAALREVQAVLDRAAALLDGGSAPAP